MVTFQRSIAAVRRYFEARGLAHVWAGVRRISVVRTESYHNEDTRCIGLNPADLRKPYGAFHRAAYLLIHELGHEFALVSLAKADRRALEPLFGDYDRPYRRARKPRRAGADFVSRYAMVHPVEDFTETFAVCLWKDWDPKAVQRLMQKKSPVCRRKLAAVERLIRREGKAHSPLSVRAPKPAVRRSRGFRRLSPLARRG
jgi:hypothetical protein